MRIKHIPSSPAEDQCLSPGLLQLRDDIAKTEGNDDTLLRLLEPIETFDYEDSPDLYDWVPVLDRLDAVLDSCLHWQPSLLLFAAPDKAREQSDATGAAATAAAGTATPAGLLRAPPAAVLKEQQQRELPLVMATLNFTSLLLRHSLNKHIYSSSEHLVALLAARDDALAAKALECVAMLALPPMLHRQQQASKRAGLLPDIHSHSYAIHNDKAASAKLMELAQGWGGRGQGLGLLACCTADDAALPPHAGDLYFEFSRDAAEDSGAAAASAAGASPHSAGLVGTAAAGAGVGAGAGAAAGVRAPSPGAAPPPRAVVVHFPEVHRQKGTAAALFERVVTQYDVPPSRWMALLARVRLAKAFATRETRCDAVTRRLLALVAVVQCHSSTDALLSYFQVQPELSQELVDLIKAHTDARLRALVPLPARLLTIHALTALVAARGGGGGGNSALGNITRHTNVFQELGVARGQYTGLLPSLLRYAVAALTGMAGGGAVDGVAAINASTVAMQPDAPAVPPSPAFSELSIGLAFVEAATGTTGSGGGGRGPAAAGLASPSAAPDPGGPPEALDRRQQELEQLAWIESVFTLVHAVVASQPGAAALTDCGLVPALLGMVQLHVDGLTNGVDEPFQRRFVICQAVQILDAAIVNHSGAHTVFRDVGATDLLCHAFCAEVTKLWEDHEATATAMAVDTDGPEVQAPGGDAAAPEMAAPAAAAVAAAGAAAPAAPATVEAEAGAAAGGGGGSAALGEADAGAAAGEGAVADVGPMPPTAGAALVAAALRRPRRLAAVPSHSQKALLYALLNCVGVALHSQGANHTVGSAQLRQPELTAALVDVFDNVAAFGGPLVAMAATLVGDIINNDPAVVSYVHTSGLAGAMLRSIKEPGLPASSELIMAVPTLLSALSLTNVGAEAVQAFDVFPALFGLLRSPDYAAPASRCFLGDMPAIIGQGMDELMRHVPRLKPDCMRALVDNLITLVAIGRELRTREDASGPGEAVIRDRALLLQYIAQTAHALEAVLAKAEHVALFCERGGMDALFALYPMAMLGPRGFLLNGSVAGAPPPPAAAAGAAAGGAAVASASPSVAAVLGAASAAHFANLPASNALSMALKSLSAADPMRLLRRLLEVMGVELSSLASA
ncbi:unnamed protein product, partial [Phaeothamnion confervicola]